MASTTVISGRVDAVTATRAASVIKAAGLTPGEVVKRVWDNIVASRAVPEEACQVDAATDPLIKLRDFQASLSALPESLIAMTDDDMKLILGSRDV